MAFQQQQRPQSARHISLPHQRVDIPQPVSPAVKRTVEGSQEWILFSPQPDTQSATTTSRTARTATHLSDFGSLETRVRSQPTGSQLEDEEEEDFTYQGTEDDEDAELDSLDERLHAFQHHPFSPISNPLDHSGGTVLPHHDGFGTFQGSGAALQEHLWQFERFNPHRKNKHARRRSRSSVPRRLEALEEEQDGDDHADPDEDRIARIEKWRLDQSRAVLEEIERETRRRRRQMSRMGATATTGGLQSEYHDALASRMQTASEAATRKDTESAEGEERAPPSESFWRRITRKVIRDLIGLDETTLSVIFGEQLIDDATPTPTQPSPLAQAVNSESRVAFHDPKPSWELKLLDRIARELGTLVHHLAEFDGTAFSTYKNAQQQQIEYAGLPRAVPRPQSLRSRRRTEKSRAENAQPDPLFSPTVTNLPTPSTTEPADTSLWGIEEESEQQAVRDDDAKRLREERDYWEKDVDVKMVFTYLKSRFSNAPTATEDDAATASAPIAESSSSGPLPASWATTIASAGPTASALSTSPEGLRRAEIIRQQHPLVSRAAERAARAATAAAAAAATAQTSGRRRDSLLLLRRHSQVQQTLVQKRPSSGAVAADSSCASQSTKRSRHSRSGGSSRHYWDLGGSVGSVGSGPVSSALGGWGEV